MNTELDWGWWHCWSVWRSGAMPPDVWLWGLSLMWWGRIGKIIEFLGALTVLADILGPQRLKDFGAALDGAIPLKSLPTLAGSALLFVARAIIYGLYFLLRKAGSQKTAEALESLKRTNRLLVVSLAILGALVFLIAAFVGYDTTAGSHHYGNGPAWIMADILLGGWILFMIFVAPILLALLALVVLLVLGILNILIIKPMAKALSNSQVELLAKIVGLVLVCAGFHFDLLAS